MSYDIRIAVKVDGAEDVFADIAEPERSSPTYNLREMFVACMNWDYKQGTYYKVSEIYPKIERGIYELTYNEEAYKKYNPSNGWGSTTSALSALISLKECIDEIENPDCWEQPITLPKDLIYMAW
jgi:hypothetical protein